MTKNILLIYGHPAKESFNRALLESYVKGAKTTEAKIQIINVRALKFSMLEKDPKKQLLEHDLKKAQEAIAWADHLVFFYPTWWGSMPALLKGFIERVFTSGFAYRFKNGGLPEKLLLNKSARVITTMDAPVFVYKLFFRAPGDRMIKQGILQFCGVKPVRITHIGSASRCSDEKRIQYLQKVETLGRQLQ
jgi:putative NADPH-quinone reductase